MGFLSKLFGGGEKKSKGIQKAIDEIKRLGAYQPGMEDLIIQLDRAVELGEIDPQLAETIFLESSGMNEVLATIDPRLRLEQFETIDQLSQLADADSLDPQAMAMLRQARSMEDTRLAGDIGAIEQQARRRGMGGQAGMDIGNQLLAAQHSANRMAQSGFDEAASARERALQAMMQKAQMSGDIEERDFAQKSAVAQAQDRINEFNAANRQSQINRNIDAINQAQAANLDRRYEIQADNLAAQRAEEAARAQAERDLYAMRSERAHSIADYQVGKGAAKAGEHKAGVQGLGNIIGTVASFFSDPDIKENVGQFDPGEFLDSITGHEYDYINGPKGQVGVMSDDLKKTEFGRQAVDDSGVYDVVNYAKLMPGVTASVANLNDRLKKLEKK